MLDTLGVTTCQSNRELGCMVVPLQAPDPIAAGRTYRPNMNQAAWISSSNNPFEDVIWLEESAEKVRGVQQLSINGGLIIEDYLRPFAAELDSYQELNPGNLDFLDWGGGIGQSAPYLVNPGRTYTVVDGSENCRVGEKLFASVSNIFFKTTVPSCCNYDVVLLNGSLQYIENWQDVFKLVGRLRSKFLFIGRVPIGAEPTAFGSQNISCGPNLTQVGTVNRWIFCRDQLLETAQLNGFMLKRDDFNWQSSLALKQDGSSVENIEIRSMLFGRCASK